MHGEDPLGLPGIVLQEVLGDSIGEDVPRSARETPRRVHHRACLDRGPSRGGTRLKNLCVSKGLNVSGIDCLIAATAILRRNELFTADTDFASISRMSGLKLFARGEIA